MADNESAALRTGGQVLRRIHKALAAILNVSTVLMMVAILTWMYVGLTQMHAELGPPTVPTAAQLEHVPWWFLTIVGFALTVDALLYFTWPVEAGAIWRTSRWPRLAGLAGVWGGAIITWYAAALALGAKTPVWMNDGWTFLIVSGGPMLTLQFVEAMLRRRERRHAAREEPRGGA
jgi:hypothetical protein